MGQGRSSRPSGLTDRSSANYGLFVLGMVEAKKNERANLLKEVKLLCKKFGFTAGMLKGAIAKGRGEMTPQEFTKAVQPRVIANKNFNKIFCIGYNKTGTTTLETVLRLYGYNMPNQQQQEIRLSKSTFKTNYDEFISFCSNYDAFQDMPFSQGLTYVAADAIFPNSKFILSERSADSWYNSMCKFHKQIFNLDDVAKLTEADVLEKFTYLYPGYSHSNKKRMLSSFENNSTNVNWDKLYDADWYIDMYTRRNEEIKRYFMEAPEKLLVIDVTQEKTTEKICQFLNIPNECIIDMPHSNKT